MVAASPPSLDDGLPTVVLAVLVVLLVLLATVIWVAFCMAVHRTAKRMAELKRQRRRQTIIAAAISRAVNEGPLPAEVVTRGSMAPMYFADYGQRSNMACPAEIEMGVLPTYEEAVQMQETRSTRPPPPPHFASEVESVETLPRRHSSKRVGEKQLRIAPDRPGGAMSVSVLPPSYESTQRPHSRSALVAYLGGSSNPASPSSPSPSPVFYSTHVDDGNFASTSV